MKPDNTKKNVTAGPPMGSSFSSGKAKYQTCEQNTAKAATNRRPVMDRKCITPLFEFAGWRDGWDSVIAIFLWSIFLWFDECVDQN